MSNDTTKLLKACVEYRAMVDKLETENAALREAKDMVELERCEMMRSMSLVQNYCEQLRADKERLDWIIGKAPYLFFKALRSDLAKGRDQIDAARKQQS